MNTVLRHLSFYPHGCWQLVPPGNDNCLRDFYCFPTYHSTWGFKRRNDLRRYLVVIYSTLIQEELLARNSPEPSASCLLPPLLRSISFGVSTSPSVMAPGRLYWLSQLESSILDVHSNNLFWLDFLTGTTLIIIATDAFSRYKTATSAVVKSTIGLLCLTSAQLSNLKKVCFSLPMAYVNISQLMGWTLNQKFHRTLANSQPTLSSLAWRKTKLKLKMQVDYYIYRVHFVLYIPKGFKYEGSGAENVISAKNRNGWHRLQFGLIAVLLYLTEVYW